MSNKNKKVNEINLSSILGNYGSAGLKGMIGQDRGLSTQEIMTRDIFIKDFISDALTSLNAAIKGNLVTTKPSLTTTSTQPTEPVTQTPQGQALAAKRAEKQKAVQAKIDQTAKSKVSQPQSPTQQASANINMTYQGQPVDTKSANLASQIPSTPTIPSTATGTTQKPIQPRQTVAQKAQAQLQRQAAKKAKGTRNQPIKEDTYTKLNLLFETIMSGLSEQDQQPQYTIKDYLEQVWFPNYMKGVNYTKYKPSIDKLLQQIQNTYAKDRGKNALTQLANFSYSISPQAKPIDNAPKQNRNPQRTTTPPRTTDQQEEVIKATWDGIEYTKGKDGWIDPTGRIAEKNIAKYLDQIEKQR